MTIINAPAKYNPELSGVTVYLAGVVDRAVTEDWRDQITTALGKLRLSFDITVFNPKRNDWDEGWIPEMNNPQFSEQVNWELDALNISKWIIVYFKKNAQAPVSILEFGMYADSGRLLVCCEGGFWKKGNIDIICSRKNIPAFETMQQLTGHLVNKLMNQ
jgi:hypothetical protein